MMNVRSSRAAVSALIKDGHVIFVLFYYSLRFSILFGAKFPLATVTLNHLQILGFILPVELETTRDQSLEDLVWIVFIRDYA